MKTALFDLDGTLADIKHRRKFLEGEQPDWKSFNRHMGDDTPNLPIVSLYKTLWASGQYEIIILTGRNENSRAVTEQWLAWNEIPFKNLIMRQENDFRTDHIIKEEMLKALVIERTREAAEKLRASIPEQYRAKPYEASAKAPVARKPAEDNVQSKFKAATENVPQPQDKPRPKMSEGFNTRLRTHKLR